MTVIQLSLLLLLSMCNPLTEANYLDSDPFPLDSSCDPVINTTPTTETTTPSTSTTATSSSATETTSNTDSSSTATPSPSSASSTTPTAQSSTATSPAMTSPFIQTPAATPKHQLCTKPKQSAITWPNSLFRGMCIEKPVTGHALAFRYRSDLETRDYSKVLTFKPIVFFEKGRGEKDPHVYLENHRGLNVFFVWYNNEKSGVILDANEPNNCANDQADCLPFEYNDVNAIIYTICWNKEVHSDGLFIDTLIEEVLS
ncbi:uncharacterized protein CELE_F49C5.7 [Caenorhabditis elegans]|uniref:Uncharacterized protein n=1 Tax=Caenorhabditis elegans TaxID=6239 RepID=O17881_CAEEL|nr:Uncharacterized protein CELE_F49C5.7 [Caenorhabditis elegans]CAB04435.3 Uncharacterized protein CELE_F49C5.7 [Caenorhabditis elegans]